MMNSNEDQLNDQNTDPKNFRHSMGRGKWIKIPFLIAGVVLIKAAVVLFLWNNLIPELFHGPELNYIHSIGLIILAKLLVGSMAGFKGFRGRHDHHFGHHFGHHHGHFKGHFEKHFGKFEKGGRWDGLSSEEREALREMIRERGEK